MLNHDDGLDLVGVTMRFTISLPYHMSITSIEQKSTFNMALTNDNTILPILEFKRMQIMNLQKKKNYSEQNFILVLGLCQYFVICIILPFKAP